MLLLSQVVKPSTESPRKLDLHNCEHLAYLKRSTSLNSAVPRQHERDKRRGQRIVPFYQLEMPRGRPIMETQQVKGLPKSHMIIRGLSPPQRILLTPFHPQRQNRSSFLYSPSIHTIKNKKQKQPAPIQTVYPLKLGKVIPKTSFEQIKRLDCELICR